MADQQALARVLRHFARTMAGTYDITEVLYEVSDSLVEVLLGATAAGVALLDGDELRFVTATNTVGEEAEHIQERLQSGPCLESVQSGQPVFVSDLAACHDRWPDYAPAVERIGLRAVLAIPLVLEGRRIGSIDVYSAEPRQWSEEATDAALVLADVCAAYLVNARELAQSRRTAGQLQKALESRVVIEQAKGVLAERIGVSTDEAFQRIRASARHRRIRITDVCRRVIDTDHVPD